jgi:hypothetical protein
VKKNTKENHLLLILIEDIGYYQVKFSRLIDPEVNFRKP